jgi:serine/threonine-protein kinase
LNYRAIWSPDGQSLTFISNRAGERDVWMKRADGSGRAELVLDREQQISEVLNSPDGEWLVFREGGYSAGDIYRVQASGDAEPVPLVATEAQEREIALSPDGRWLAYVSNRSGRDEVYVRPFPDAMSARWQVSTGGGTEPLWAHSGRELFYRNGASELVAVQVSGNPSFAVGRQDVLFSVADYLFGNGRPQYDVNPDDQRFVLLRIGTAAGTDPILVEGFVEELKGTVER